MKPELSQTQQQMVLKSEALAGRDLKAVLEDMLKKASRAELAMEKGFEESVTF